jgi:hypothetical protein
VNKNGLLQRVLHTIIVTCNAVLNKIKLLRRFITTHKTAIVANFLDLINKLLIAVKHCTKKKAILHVVCQSGDKLKKKKIGV